MLGEKQERPNDQRTCRSLTRTVAARRRNKSNAFFAHHISAANNKSQKASPLLSSVFNLVACYDATISKSQCKPAGGLASGSSQHRALTQCTKKGDLMLTQIIFWSSPPLTTLTNFSKRTWVLMLYKQCSVSSPQSSLDFIAPTTARDQEAVGVTRRCA